MRNIVEHGQISGSSDTTVLSGCSAARRWTRWISVPTPMAAPAGASSTRPMMASVEPTWSASSHDLVRALGVHDHDAVGVLGPEGGDVLGPEPLVHRAVALPQEERRLLDVAPRRGRRARGAGSTPACASSGVAHGHAGVAAEVLVGEEEHLVTDAGVPLRPPPSAHSSTARALDEVHTAPPWRADERLEGGGRVHVGDRHDPVDVGDVGEGVPRLLDLVDVGHVGHRAPGVEVGEDDAAGGRR